MFIAIAERSETGAWCCKYPSYWFIGILLRHSGQTKQYSFV